MIFIDIMVSKMLAAEVEPLLARCCSQTGDFLLGRKIIQDIKVVRFLVGLSEDPHISIHLPILSEALCNKMIISFHFAHGSILRLSSPTIDKQLPYFPFTFGDFWLMDIHSEKDVYLCVPRGLLNGQQAAWLQLRRDINWEYL